VHVAFRHRHHHRRRRKSPLLPAPIGQPLLQLPPLLPPLLPSPQPPSPSSTPSPPPPIAPLPQPSPPPSLQPLPSPPPSLTTSTANAHRRYPRHLLQIRWNSRHRRSSHHFTTQVNSPRNPDSNAPSGASDHRSRTDLAQISHRSRTDLAQISPTARTARPTPHFHAYRADSNMWLSFKSCRLLLSCCACPTIVLA
jgi:hypothetical protein